MKYAQIRLWLGEVGNRFGLTAYLRAFKLSRSGYYDWQKRRELPAKPATLALESCALAAHAAGRGVYGSKRLLTEMAERGHPCALSTVKRLRRRLGLVHQPKRRWQVTTDSCHNNPIAPNLLNQQFDQALRPNQVWVTDITYVDTPDGWLYVAGVKDVYTAKLVGWSMMNHMRVELVMQALDMAVKQQRPPSGLIHHSDRGSQYTCARYLQMLDKYQMVASMSRRGNCYDNAPMESFWASLKKECVYQNEFESIDDAKIKIFDYIEGFYNTTRRHSKLGNQSPRQFERAYWQTQAQGETQGESIPPAPPSQFIKFKETEETGMLLNQ